MQARYVGWNVALHLARPTDYLLKNC